MFEVYFAASLIWLWNALKAENKTQEWTLISKNKIEVLSSGELSEENICKVCGKVGTSEWCLSASPKFQVPRET